MVSARLAGVMAAWPIAARPLARPGGRSLRGRMLAGRWPQAVDRAGCRTKVLWGGGVWPQAKNCGYLLPSRKVKMAHMAHAALWLEKKEA